MNADFDKGKIVKGKVTGIKNYGIFISFQNGFNGLIHISEISPKFVKNIYDYAHLNEIIPCKIISINLKNKTVRLTIKDLDYIYRRDRTYNKNFEALKKNLPIWIDEKWIEITKKKN